MHYTKDELIKFEKTLEEAGYKKMSGHYKNEDYAWWKSFYHDERDEYDDKVSKYQIAFMVYDFGKYHIQPKDQKHYSIACEYLSSSDVRRYDMTISSVDTYQEFEELCEKFYDLIENTFK